MRSKWEEMFALHCRVEKLEVQRELVFAPPRKWRFDFALPEMRLAIEIEGGTWAGGRHTRGSGFEKDSRKYNAAAKLGWRVLRYTGAMVESGEAVNDVLEIKRGDVMDEAMKKIAEFAFNHADVHLTTTGSMFAACEAVLAEAQRREARPAPADVVERMRIAYVTGGGMPAALETAREGYVPASELQDLRRWKKERMQVESEWDAQEVGRELGLPLGSSIRAGILPAIKRLKQQLVGSDSIGDMLSRALDSKNETVIELQSRVDELEQQLATMYTKEQVENFLLRFGQLNDCGALMGKVSREMRTGITAPKPEPTPQEKVEAVLRRGEKIAELDEEIGLVGEQVDEWAGCKGTPELFYYACWTRTLARLQAARAELTRGMVTPQPKESQ